MKIPYTHSTPDPEVAVALEVGKKHDIDEAMIIYTSKIEVRDWVLLRCKYGCEHYGKSHSCPPNSITPDEMRKLMREYRRAMLIVGKTKNSNERSKFRKALVEMENALFEKNHYKAFALVPGCCEKCESCAAKEGKACRNPSENRPCIEGTGIDVFSLVRKHKKKIQTAAGMKKSGESFGLILLD